MPADDGAKRAWNQRRCPASDRQEELRGVDRIIITACRDQQSSFIGDGALTIFTTALVDGLRGAGASGQRRYVSAFDLYSYVHATVSQAVGSKYGRRQDPELTILKGIGAMAVALRQGAPLPPEIAREVFRRIDPDIRLEGVTVDFGELIDALRDGRIDVIAAGIFVTPQRCAQIDFSEPTYVVGESFVVRAGNPRGLTDFASISDHEQAKVALIAGTVEWRRGPRAPTGLTSSSVLAVSMTKAGTGRGVAAS